jgi:uncharacterized membrane protein YkoI
MPSTRLTIALLAVLTLAVSTAESATRTPPARDAVQVVGNIVLADGGISLNQAISMVERRFKARVVRSDVRQEGERKIYVLRLLDDAGNAQVVRVDAASGAIL